MKVDGDTSAPTFDEKRWSLESKKEGLHRSNDPAWSVEVWKRMR